MNNLIIKTILIVVITFSAVNPADALSVVTHEEINGNIVQNILNGFSLDEFLKKRVGLFSGIEEEFNSVSAWQLIRRGGRYEDKPPWYPSYLRSVNHFHNPVAQSLGSAGFSGIWDTGLLSGVSAVLWSQWPLGMQSTTVPFSGNYSWFDARDFFYKALTSTNLATRNNNFADMFRGLGQLMHLVQDMSVPEHARNDGHYLEAYEEWVEEAQNTNPLVDPQRRAIFDNAFSNPIFFTMTALGQASAFGTAAPSPVANLFDTKQYDGTNPAKTMNQNIGLSEYTNANFVSADTLFTNFLYPSLATSVTTTDYIIPDPVFAGSTVARQYYKKTSDGDSGYRLAGVGYLTLYLDNSGFDPDTTSYATIPSMDGNVYGDYAQRLLPRAVGYSAALLNYFFRGSIDITVPNDGFYALATKSDNGFTSITLLAQNTTGNNEEMTGGTVELVVKYQPAQDTPFVSQVVSEKTGTRSIPRDNPAELTFDLSANPIPFTATDVTVQLVYHGRLGNEDGAVAVGFKDISEPTPIDIANNMDKICLNGSWYAAGSQAAITVVDTNSMIGNNNGVADEWDVYSHTLGDVFIKISSAADPLPASSTDYDVQITGILAGKFARTFYILSDDHFGYGFHISRVNDDSRDIWSHPETSSAYAGTAIRNQLAYIDDSAKCALIDQSTPCYYREPVSYYDFRGADMWWGGGLVYMNKPYPDTALCAW